MHAVIGAVCDGRYLVRKAAGTCIKNVNLALYFDGKEIYQGFGEMLFTHFGVSGPLVLSASSYYSAQLAKWTKKTKRKNFRVRNVG